MTDAYDYRPPLGFDIRVSAGRGRGRRGKASAGQGGQAGGAGRGQSGAQSGTQSGAQAGTQVRTCEWRGCEEKAEHKAPKSRENLREYRWFCLRHVQEYNKSWDFFKGMSDAEVADYQATAAFGHRPTWTLGRNGIGKDPAKDGKGFRPGKDRPRGPDFANPWADDAFGFFGGTSAETNADRPRRRVGRLHAEALAVFDLDEDATMDDVKARYKDLVKRFHPDTNGGDRSTEVQLQKVIKAYQVLKNGNFR